MAALGMEADSIQRNRPIPINRPATPLPECSQSRGYYENRLETVCGNSRHCCRRIALSVLLCRRQARRTGRSFRTHARIHSSGTRPPSTLVCLGERPRSALKRAGGRLTASSCPKWMRSGMVWHGEYWMRSFSAWPNDASVCSLLEVLEPCVARKYFLSAKACRGIISRADRRGKPLPTRLRNALEKQIMILAA